MEGVDAQNGMLISVCLFSNNRGTFLATRFGFMSSDLISEPLRNYGSEVKITQSAKKKSTAIDKMAISSWTD